MTEITRAVASAALASSETKVACHTPGPWSECHDMDGDYTIFAGTKIIAITDLDRDDDKANARLIAAAPEMLAKLEELYDWLDGIGDGAPDASPTSRRALNHASEIDDIIRKATVSA